MRIRVRVQASGFGFRVLDHDIHKKLSGLPQKLLAELFVRVDVGEVAGRYNGWTEKTDTTSSKNHDSRTYV